MSKRICLGRIAGAHGVKGLTKIEVFGDDPKLLESLSPLYTDMDGNECLHIALKNRNGKFWLAAVETIDNREAAQAMRGTFLYVDRDSLPAIEKDNVYYAQDLKGLNAIDRNGNVIGRVDDVQDFGAGDLLDITLQTGENFYLPFRDHYVGEIDLNAGTIMVQNYQEMIIE